MERLLENIAQSGNPAATAALRNGFGSDDADANEASVEDESSPQGQTSGTLASIEPQPQTKAQPSPPPKSDEMVIPPEDPNRDTSNDGFYCIPTLPDSQRVCKYVGGSAGIHLFGKKNYTEKTFGTKKIFFPDQYGEQAESGEIADGGVFVIRDQYEYEYARDVENAQLEMQGALPPKNLVDLLIKT
jgi:hypothetical protein